MNRSFETRQLEIFAALAKSGSFTAAARQMSLTQSAISHSLRALESDLECSLIERVGRSVLLTPAGEHLFKEATRILNDLKRTRQEVESISAWGRGRLRISASVTACEFLLPSILREFKECFPEAPIQIAPADSPEARQLLRSHQVDLALVVGDGEEGGFQSQQLFSDELHFVVGSAHPWARAQKFDPKTVSEQPFILYNRNSLTFKLIEQHFQQRRWQLHGFIEMGSMNAIKELIKIGLGVGLLPRWIVDKELQEGSLCAIPLTRPRLKRNWNLIRLEAKKNSRLQRKPFRAFAQQPSRTLPWMEKSSCLAERFVWVIRK